MLCEERERIERREMFAPFPCSFHFFKHLLLGSGNQSTLKSKTFGQSNFRTNFCPKVYSSESVKFIENRKAQRKVA